MPENSAEGLMSRRSRCWGYISMRILPKSYCIYPLKLLQLYLVVKERGQLDHSSHRVEVVVESSNPDLYWRKRQNQQAHLELCHRNPDILERVLDQIALSSSTAGKCAPTEVIKQQEHGRTSTSDEQKWSSFQMNYMINCYKRE